MRCWTAQGVKAGNCRNSFDAHPSRIVMPMHRSLNHMPTGRRILPWILAITLWSLIGSTADETLVVTPVHDGRSNTGFVADGNIQNFEADARPA